jgi:WD40 repeat protein
VIELQGWKEPVIHAIGGLTELGFDESGRYLLVVSHQGNGVIDLQTLKRVARDYDEQAAYGQHESKTVEGIGPIAGQNVKCVGLWGGKLKGNTSDGWHVSISDKEIVTLSNPHHKTVSMPEPFTALRAVGFSEDGEILVYATSSEIEIYKRDGNTVVEDEVNQSNGIPTNKKLSKWEEWSGVVYALAFIIISSTLIWHFNENLNFILIITIFGLGLFLDFMSVVSSIQNYYAKRNVSGFFILGFVLYLWAWLSYPHSVLFSFSEPSLVKLWLYKIPDLVLMAVIHLLLNISYGKKKVD